MAIIGFYDDAALVCFVRHKLYRLVFNFIRSHFFAVLFFHFSSVFIRCVAHSHKIKDHSNFLGFHWMAQCVQLNWFIRWVYINFDYSWTIFKFLNTWQMIIKSFTVLLQHTHTYAQNPIQQTISRKIEFM